MEDEYMENGISFYEVKHISEHKYALCVCAYDESKEVLKTLFESFCYEWNIPKKKRDGGFLLLLMVILMFFKRGLQIKRFKTMLMKLRNTKW